MIAFLGIFSSLFYIFLLGIVWPFQNNAQVSVVALSTIGKSLWMGWALVVVMYFFDIKLSFVFILLVWSVLYALQIKFSERMQLTIFEIGILSFLTFLLAVFLVWVLNTGVYSLIFTKGDAVASWNKWGVELSDNKYFPWNAAYPILFPGIWSLIYKAQSNALIWPFAKASLFILPIIISLAVFLLVQTKRVLAAIFCLILSYYFLLVHPESMLDGYMDIPVTVMIFVATISMIAVVDNIENHGTSDDLYDLLCLSGVFSGLSAITKQPGSSALAIFLILVVFLALKKRISLRHAGILTFISVLPLASFLLMYWSKESELLGNLVVLKEWSEKVRVMVAPDGNKYESAYKLLIRNIGIYPIPIMVVAALFNLVSIKKLSGQLGIIFLLVSILGFLIYSNCCSYNERNGWWLYVFLLSSVVLSFSRLESVFGFLANTTRISVPAYIVTISFIAVAFITAVFGGLVLPDSNLKTWHNKQQWALMPAGVEPLLKKMEASVPAGTNDWVIISPYQPVRWLPGYLSNYRLCIYSASVCANEEIKKSSRAFILINKKNSYYRYADLKVPLSENKLIGTAHDLLLYGPFSSIDLR